MPWMQPQKPPPAADAEGDLASSLKSLSQFAQAYAHFTPHMHRMDVIWQSGSTRLLQPKAPIAASAPIVLIIPSLINTWKIFDLTQKRSFVNHLIQQGLRPVICDWGTPADAETTFSLSDYITKRLLPAIASLDAPVYVVGYCLGGIMAMAAQALLGEKLCGMSLIATPWDFASPAATAPLHKPNLSDLTAHFDPTPCVPAELIHSWFFMMHHEAVLKKLAHFTTLDAEHQLHFVAKEYWLNDGVDVPNAVIEECFLSWPITNPLFNNEWHVNGVCITPSALHPRTLVFTGEHDAIAPHKACAPLCSAANAKHHQVPTGHLGLVVGRHAQEKVWNPLVRHAKSR